MYYKRCQDKTSRIQSICLNYEELFVTSNNDLWAYSRPFEFYGYLYYIHDSLHSNVWLFTFHMFHLDFITYHLLHKTNYKWDDDYIREIW